jgi:hypothetical protein
LGSTRGVESEQGRLDEGASADKGKLRNREQNFSEIV